ncbi:MULTISPECIES: branched-chain amino acid-like transporter carrier protein BrnQ3 [Staphylococcus]|jgi:LIVCS family branched-chain amino acid:cation transporter|uniref:Branched-chain amino acid transport system carrier protein n=1 Tax=Staphylococcus nepalensis TaxID=214473 RepID=A0A291JKU5_9STAP|nr:MULTISPECIES: branched-chain amino acid transport system II carrier protein [Staphylococcus]VDG67124.1 branched-chain amino acid permease [Lacrimispora indolis]ATH60113.1 branched-chain amino acid transport system II carrier protein [Staphylococcus nepalensis]ATH65203.1 branched-chain amino acid transport system II carrier protein [Staphylococcus nepalensis]MBO1204923.1 branched-chain amino acid transport system II carrier protein [Staphylococcus nepalensis]MBO1213531.1 branched-chain amino
MNKNTWIIGFTLFAMFFGAGNLIFPPNLGLDSGQYFWPAILAFALTGIGLPLLGVVVGALDKQGYIGSLNKISPKFSVIFLIIIYLTIGPLFAIPRTASTSFEMTITPITHTNSALALLIFTVIYFLIVLYLCINPNKMINRIGSLLTPLLLITILAMIIKGFVDYGSNAHSQSAEAFTSNFSGFSQGFTNGYLTMDAIAAIAFSMIVVNAVKSTGISHANQIFKQTLLAGIIAAIALMFIYISLGFIGNHMAVPQEKIASLTANDQNIGTYLLTTMASTGFGTFGKYLLGIIVALACLTTACGLIVSVSEYFNRIFPKISYKLYVIIFTLISFILANQGLNSVITMSVPVLSIVYPIAITSVLLILIARFVPTKPIAQQIPVAVVAIVSILSVIHTQGWINISIIDSLPLKDYSLEWFPIAVITTIIGYLVSLMLKNQQTIVYEKE